MSQNENLFDAPGGNLLMSPIRFPIMVLLALYEEADFTFIKKELNMSDGNLGANLKKLEAEGFLTSKKMFVGAKPKTTYRISKTGREELQTFIDSVKKIDKALSL